MNAKRQYYIFVHGLGQTSASWNETVELLEAMSEKPGMREDNVDTEICCSCPDLTELSGEKEVNYQNLYAAFAEYCDAFQEPVILCGLSLGAILALHYGIEHPRKVRSMILIAAQYRMPRKLLTLQNFIFRFMPRSMFGQMGFQKEQFIRLSQSMMELDFSNAMEKITCPVLVVCGEKDKANRKAAQELESLIPRAELCVIEGAGHEVNVEAAERLAESVWEFDKN